MPSRFSLRLGVIHSILVPLFVLAVLSSCKMVGANQSGLSSSLSSGSTAKMTELNSSIIAVGNGDWLTDRCVNMVDRAAQYQQSKIMFVPTLFWVQNGDGPIDHYCYERVYDSNGKVSCAAADPEKIATFKAAMQKCFQRAIDNNLSIALTPHLDDGTGQGRWRNVLIFDPLEKRNGYSYADVAVFPLADALNAIAKPNTKIYFGMQGEMSATVFRHPASWRQLIPMIKSHLTAGKDASFSQNIQIGVSTNFNKLAGCVGLDIVDPGEYVKQYPALWNQVKDQFDLIQIQALYNEIDYFGMSSYPSLYPYFPTSAVEGAISQFDFEFSFFGMTVNELIAKGKHVHFSEYGVGGGISQNGNVKATDAAGAASFPFFGIFSSYSTATDPWMLYNPDVHSEVRDYQRYFYDRTLEYLSNQKHYKYRIDAAFLWNQSSWDVQAVYPESTSSQGSYKDSVITDKINAYNSAAMAGIQTFVCTDLQPPPGTYTCAQEAGWNKCNESYMAEYCDKSCGRCQ